MKKRILITGGAGFIGSNLAVALSSLGHEVLVLDNLTPQIHGAMPETADGYLRLKGRVRFVRGDVTCRREMQMLMHDIDTVVHLAAETGTGQSMYEIEHYAHVNVGGTALMLNLIANDGFAVRRVIVASSRAVYGEGKYTCAEHGVQYPGPRSLGAMKRGLYEHSCPTCGAALRAIPTDEESALKPASVYGVTKLTQEQLVLTVAKARGFSALAFRFQNVFGPGQSLSNPYTGILSIFSSRLRQGKSINIFEDGNGTRDFVYIDDVIAALCRGIDLVDHSVDVFNVGSGVATSVLTIATKLRTLLNSNSSITVSGDVRAGDIRHNIADLCKVTRQLGFVPSVTIDEGLTRFSEWVNGQAITADRYDESLKELRSKGLFS